jgi:large subunit ribosomal protein L25
MAMSEKSDAFVLEVERREVHGSGASRQMRASGRVPAVVYGGGLDPLNIAVHEKDFSELLKQEYGENTIFLLKLKGTKQERLAMIHEMQVDPISRSYLHVDFIRITKGHAVRVNVPVELVGDSVGVRHGGLMDFQTRELDIEVLPGEMFEKIVVDISELDVDQTILVQDVLDQLPKSGRALDDPERVIVAVVAPRAVEEEEEEVEEAAELITDEETEPEVIRKGRGDEEEGGES